MINKEKIVRFDVKDKSGNLIISTDKFDFPKDFFKIRKKDLVILKGSDIEIGDIGQKVDVIVYYKNGDRYLFETELDLATDMQVNIHLGNDYIMMEERRNSFKTCSDTEGEIADILREHPEVENEEEREENIVFDPPMSVKIKNINLGGVFIESDYEFHVGDIFSLSLIDGQLVTATKILRIQRDKHDNIMGYGCKFLKLNSSEEAIVSRFIFDCQLAQREKLKQREMFM